MLGGEQNLPGMESNNSFEFDGRTWNFNGKFDTVRMF